MTEKYIIPKQLQNINFRFNLLKPKDKMPFEKEWQKNAYSYNDEKLIEHINSGGNYGIIGGYGRLRLLDIDNPSFVPQIEKEFKTFSVKTGKNGRHFYFLSDYDKNHVLPNGIGELRANMQFVVAPGSIHPNGNKYEVYNDLPLLDITEDRLQEILLPIIKKNPLQKTDYGKMLKGEALPGERNDGYFRTACFMRFQKIPISVAIETLTAANQKNKKPIPQNELDRVVKNAYSYSNVKEKETKQTNKQVVLKIDNYIDNVERFREDNPFFYDKSNLFWVWNTKLCKYEILDDTDMMILIDANLGFQGQTVGSGVKNNYLEAFKRVGRSNIPKEAPKKWIQFKDKAYSIKSNNIYDVTPDYFFTNSIPWEIGLSEETPIIDKLFTEWVGEKYKDTLYELIAYCCYTDYPIQLLFCLVGSGRNGKGCFLKILDKFIGNDNVTSTSLDLISGNNKSRFESFRLYKKLVAIMGETNFGLLSNTSLLKQLTGGDKIGFEKKGKDPFSDYNYAKIIIASNSLPTTQDTSDGFFRRWLIIDFPNEFKEGKDITQQIPEYEYNNLALKVLKILPKLLEAGYFKNQGDIQERKRKYIFSSNPLSIFLKLCCIKDEDNYVSQNKLYTAYVTYLNFHKKRRVKITEFKAALEDEGYWIDRTTKKVLNNKTMEYDYKSARWIEGIDLKGDWRSHFCDSYDVYDAISTSPYIEKNEMEKVAQVSQTSQKVVEETVEDTEIGSTSHYLSIIREKTQETGKGYPKEPFIEKYGFDTLKSLLEQGEVIESPAGWIKVLE